MSQVGGHVSRSRTDLHHTLPTRKATYEPHQQVTVERLPIEFVGELVAVEVGDSVELRLDAGRLQAPVVDHGHDVTGR